MYCQLSNHPSDQCWDVTATVCGVRTLQSLHEAQAACAALLGRVAYDGSLTRQPALELRKTAAWSGAPASLTHKARALAQGLWRALGGFVPIRVGASDCTSDRPAQHWRFGLTVYLLREASLPTAPLVEIELAVTPFDGRSEALRAALARAQLWRWEPRLVGLSGTARCPMPLPFGGFVDTLTSLIWARSPGAAVQIYVHAAGERLVLEHAAGLPEFLRWERARRLARPPEVRS